MPSEATVSQPADEACDRAEREPGPSRRANPHADQRHAGRHGRQADGSRQQRQPPVMLNRQAVDQPIQRRLPPKFLLTVPPRSKKTGFSQTLA